MKTMRAGMSFRSARLNYIVGFFFPSLLLFSVCYANDSYPYGEEIFTSRNTGERKTFIGYENLTYRVSAETSSTYNDLKGGAIYYSGSSPFRVDNNMSVFFSGNKVISNAYDVNYAPYGSAASSAKASGGAIFNSSQSFTLNRNKSLIFDGNVSSAIARTETSYHNYQGYKASSYSYGGAIYNVASLIISGNNSVAFRENTARAASESYTNCDLYNEVYGGAIYNTGTFSINGNDDVVFERNAEVNKNTYRLRSIYSTGTLNLSASEGSRILFKDSIYACGAVNLNQGGAGDIILTAATTEDDLRLMKGSAGTASEITNSRTSEIGVASLYAGRLMVEDKAVCQFSGIAVEDGARIIVKDASLQHSSGSMVVTQAQNTEKAELQGTSLDSKSLYGKDAEHIGIISGAAMSISNTATLSVKYVTLDATTQFNSAATTLDMTDVTSQMAKGVNTTLVGEDMVLSDTMLARSGNGTETLTMAAGATVLQLENTAFDAKALQGETLHLILSGYSMEEIQARDYLVISFKNSAAYASLDKDLSVSLQIAGVEGAVTITGWYLASDIQNGGKATALYFETAKMPEPATATLSLLALAALAARRKRK